MVMLVLNEFKFNSNSSWKYIHDKLINSGNPNGIGTFSGQVTIPEKLHVATTGDAS